MNNIGYTRVSTDGQPTDGVSLDAQQRQVHRDALSSAVTPTAPSTTVAIKKKRGHGGGGHSTITTKPKCGAITRGTDMRTGKVADGHPCLRVAGHGTDHLGSGRCKFHAGISGRITHGLYSKVIPVVRRESYQAALTAEDPKSMHEHIALLDGVILPGALKRGESAPTHEGQPDPLMVQMQAIDIKSKVLKRLADTEQSRKIAFTQAELSMLIMQIVTIIAEYVDAKTLQKIAARIGTSPVVVKEAS
jgi:hypothetical protein